MGIVTSIAKNVLNFLKTESGSDPEAPSAEEHVATTEQEMQMIANIQQAFEEMRRVKLPRRDTIYAPVSANLARVESALRITFGLPFIEWMERNVVDH